MSAAKAKPERHIVTVATDNCRRGLSILMASLAKQGWTNPVTVFVPQGDPLDAMPNCTIVKIPAWWAGVKKIEECRNYAALLKIELMLTDIFPDGASVLYVDGSDTMFLDKPEKLFALCEKSGAQVAARPFQQMNLIRGGRRLAAKNRLCAVYGEQFGRECDYVNNGVIWWRVGAFSRLWGIAWKNAEVSEMDAIIPTSRDSSNALVGDQQTFNLIWRHFIGSAETYSIPAQWNYRGGTRVNALLIKEGKLVDNDGLVVKLAHCSGPVAFRDDIVNLGTDGSGYEIRDGGVGLAVLRPSAAAAKSRRCPHCGGKIIKKLQRRYGGKL